MKLIVKPEKVVVTPAVYRVKFHESRDYPDYIGGDGGYETMNNFRSDIAAWLGTNAPGWSAAFDRGDWGEGPASIAIDFAAESHARAFIEQFETIPCPNSTDRGARGMTQAPERIFAWAWEVNRHRGEWSEDQEIVGEGIEYRRADQPPTLAEALALPEVRALVEALGVYADPSSYSDGGREKGVLQSFIWQDKGHRARAALATQDKALRVPEVRDKALRVPEVRALVEALQENATHRKNGKPWNPLMPKVYAALAALTAQEEE